MNPIVLTDTILTWTKCSSEMLIGWPTKVLCKEDCKGICNVCGQNLNEGTCDCEDTGLDPRMSVVRDLFKNCNGSAGSARLPR